MNAKIAHDERSTDPDHYPLEASPSTDTFAVAVLNHAPEAHKMSEYHKPPADVTPRDGWSREPLPPEVAL
jgi:hypothetical protein